MVLNWKAESQVPCGHRKKGRQLNSIKSNTAENDKEQPNVTPIIQSFLVDESDSQQRPTERPKVGVKGRGRCGEHLALQPWQP